MDIQTAINLIKYDIENAITNRIVNGRTTDTKGVEYANGQKAKEALIRSQALINHIHELTKHELVRAGVNRSKIFPPLGSSKPELNISGLFKKKNQDVCVRPDNIYASRTSIDWGPLASENVVCELGPDLSEQCLVINIRSQLSSIAKNTDTLFERTFAEALNLHIKYPRMCLGEVYLIPINEYDESAMANNEVSFKNKKTNIQKYINFFTFINGRNNIEDDHHLYEKCALLIVDFNRETPRVYNSTQELIDDGHLPVGYVHELENISMNKFAEGILSVYFERFNNKNILV